MTDQVAGFPESREVAKAQARRMASAMKDIAPMSHSQALEAVAKIHGCESWGRMSSLLPGRSNPVKDDPITLPQEMDRQLFRKVYVFHLQDIRQLEVYGKITPAPQQWGVGWLPGLHSMRADGLAINNYMGIDAWRLTDLGIRVSNANRPKNPDMSDMAKLILLDVFSNPKMAVFLGEDVLKLIDPDVLQGMDQLVELGLGMINNAKKHPGSKIWNLTYRGQDIDYDTLVDNAGDFLISLYHKKVTRIEGVKPYLY